MENSVGVLQVIGTLPRSSIILCIVILRSTKLLATFFMQAKTENQNICSELVKHLNFKSFIGENGKYHGRLMNMLIDVLKFPFS